MTLKQRLADLDLVHRHQAVPRELWDAEVLRAAVRQMEREYADMERRLDRLEEHHLDRVLCDVCLTCPEHGGGEGLVP